MDLSHRAGIWAVVGTSAFHGMLAWGLASVDPDPSRPPPRSAVELLVLRPPPVAPPPDVAPPPVVLPERPPPRPRRVAMRPVAPVVPAQTAAPPPPREVPPSPEPPAAPTFGVEEEATVADGAVAVPVGGTLATQDRGPGPATKPSTPPAAATGSGSDPNAFAPVAGTMIAEWAGPIGEVKGEYPPEARRRGLDTALVRLRLDVDKTGRLRNVKVVAGAGHGFDEAALRAFSRMRFRPCRMANGAAVDCQLPWLFRFTAE